MSTSDPGLRLAGYGEPSLRDTFGGTAARSGDGGASTAPVATVPAAPTLSGPPASAPAAPAGAGVPGQSSPGRVPGRPSGTRPSGARPAYTRPPAPTGAGRAPRPQRQQAVPPPGSARRARLSLARIDPWGVLKLSFLLSVALGIIYVVAVAVLWQVIDGMGTFTEINELVRGIDSTNADFDIYDFVGFERVLSLVTVISVANVLLLTVLATLFAFLYNLGSALVGGIRVTLTDD